jgi:hypothetical protein
MIHWAHETQALYIVAVDGGVEFFTFSKTMVRSNIGFKEKKIIPVALTLVSGVNLNP